MNRDLARDARWRVRPSAGVSSEGTNRTSASPLETGEDRRRLRVARDRHPAVVASPRAVRRSRDRGCNGHRILRRVPTGGRHPGSSRSVVFHETAWTLVSALSPILRPVAPLRREGPTAKTQHRRRRVRRRVNREIATGASEARSHQRRGKKTPTLVVPSGHENLR